MSVFKGKSALITGASAGLGEEFALQLAELGVKSIILTARREERLKDLQRRLRAAQPAIEVKIIAGNLAVAEDVTKLLNQLKRLKIFPDILINNAGFGDLGTFETSHPVRMEHMINVNVTALTRLTHWALPAMLKKKQGWICNVGSTAGSLPLPTFAVYAATKAYVNSFSEALRVELHGSGVKVSLLAPGPVETEFGQVASRPKGERKFAAPAWLAVHKAEVVQKALDGLARGKARVIPGFLVRTGILAAEATPRSILRFTFNRFSGQFRRERAKK